MIGNKDLMELYSYKDRDTSINQLLELLKTPNMEFVKNLHDFQLDINKLSEDEKVFLTIAATLIDYVLNKHNLTLPEWVNDSELKFTEKFFYSKRISREERLRLLNSAPESFRKRNVFFDLNSITRI
ncbi:hypothetical protein ACSW8S_17700 (plasmid) [Clostridium perfringens]